MRARKALEERVELAEASLKKAETDAKQKQSEPLS